MMIVKLILIGLMQLTSDTYASDEWLCTTQASTRRSSSILACGVAVARDETTARADAFTAAMDEFHRVCNNSIDCVEHEIQVMPQRTECEADTGSRYKCYRLVTVYIGHKILPLKRIRTVVAEAVKVEVKREVAQVKAQVVKLRKGMSKSKLIAAFGMPYDIVHFDDDTLYYDNHLCRPNRGVCHISFKHNKLVSMENVDTQYQSFE